MLPLLEVVEKSHGDIIFNDYEHVHIVINGRVLLRYHEEDPLEFQYIAQYMLGKVLGHPSLDGGISLLGQVFPVVISTKCVLIKVKRQYFDQVIWPKTKSFQIDVRYQMLIQFRLCRKLCEQTLYDLLCNNGSIKLFKPGQLVLQIHPRSPLNRVAREQYYD